MSTRMSKHTSTNMSTHVYTHVGAHWYRQAWADAGAHALTHAWAVHTHAQKPLHRHVRGQVNLEPCPCRLAFCVCMQQVSRVDGERMSAHALVDTHACSRPCDDPCANMPSRMSGHMSIHTPRNMCLRSWSNTPCAHARRERHAYGHANREYCLRLCLPAGSTSTSMVNGCMSTRPTVRLSSYGLYCYGIWCYGLCTASIVMACMVLAPMAMAKLVMAYVVMAICYGYYDVNCKWMYVDKNNGPYI